MTISNIHNKLRVYYVSLFLIVVCSSAVLAQEIKPENCNDSDANFKVCFSKALQELKFYKDDAKGWAKLLKESQSSGRITTDQLNDSKVKYNAAKVEFDRIAKDLAAGTPNWSRIKIRTTNALPLYEGFTNDAATKLSKPISGSGILDTLINAALNALTGNPRQAIIDLAKVLLKEFAVKTAVTWVKWDKIKAT